MVSYLKSQGYRVLCVDRMTEYGCDYTWNHIPYGAEDFTGDLPLQERIEIIKDAVLNARQSARENGIGNVQFVCADAADKLLYLSKKNSIDLLVVDPPRSGLDDAMLAVILRSKIREIIYVSCNPSTLAKNLAVLSERYKVKRIVPFDMFPNTAKVETIVKLERK